MMKMVMLASQMQIRSSGHWQGYSKMVDLGSSLVVQWLGLGTFTAVAQVQSLVREL